MITVSAAAAAAIEDGTFTYDVRASVWLGGALLADDVPVADGTEESDRSLNVPERITLTVPKSDDQGRSWTPVAETDPLAAAGQTVKIMLGIGTAGGMEWFQRGEFLILSSEEGDDGQSVRSTLVGLLYRVQEAGFVGPFQPAGTLASTLRALIEPAMQADLSGAPADLAVPAAVNFDTDRIGAVYNVLDAWSAVAYTTQQGTVLVLPDVTPDTPVATFTNGVGGTVVTAAGKSTRDGAFNVVVATGTAPDGTEVRGVAFVDSGPWAYPGGAANPLPVPYGYASPLLQTQAQADAAAVTVLRRKLREAVRRRFTITAQVDPRLQLGDPVRVVVDGSFDGLCTIERVALPYRPAPMVVDVVSVE